MWLDVLAVCAVFAFVCLDEALSLKHREMRLELVSQCFISVAV
jgi:hypothetical protein